MMSEANRYVSTVYTTILCQIMAFFIGAFYFDISPYHPIAVIVILATPLFLVYHLIVLLFHLVTETSTYMFQLIESCIVTGCLGILTGPYLRMIDTHNNMIIYTALLYTTMIFAGFSLVTFFAPTSSFALLGGLLMSLLNIMCVYSFLNIFLQSSIYDEFELYIGLSLFACYVMYDTHILYERAKTHRYNTILDSLNLALDFFNIFIRITNILVKSRKMKK